MAGDIRPVLKSIKLSPYKILVLKTPKILQLSLQCFLPFVSWSVDSIFKPFPRSVSRNFNEKINAYHICYN